MLPTTIKAIWYLKRKPINIRLDQFNINSDKFQGQEAAVVIISMAVSSIEDSPRGLDFVFNINRLNVAVSRAQALAIIVANQDLEQCSVHSLEQMAKVGFFCRLISSFSNAP